jgi:thioredoxin-like negative regulator of GroEL
VTPIKGRAILQAGLIAQNLAMTQFLLHTLDESTYHRRLAQTPALALVLFTSPDCGTCRVVERHLPASAPPEATLFKVNVQVASGLARAFEVFHLPTLFLYVNGHYHARLNCQITARALRAAIEHALQHPAEEEP